MPTPLRRRELSAPTCPSGAAAAFPAPLSACVSQRTNSEIASLKREAGPPLWGVDSWPGRRKRVSP